MFFYNKVDPRWMWFSGMFVFIGGGGLILNALLHALIAETVPNNSLWKGLSSVSFINTRPNCHYRSTFYLYSAASALIAIVIGSSSSLSIMKMSLWLPVSLGVFIRSLNIMIIVLFIDRVPTGRQPETAEGFYLLPATDSERPHETEADMNEPGVGTNLIWRQVMTLKITLRGCLFPLLVCVSQKAGNSFRDILPYWLSKEYHWNLRETGYVELEKRLLTAFIISLLPRLSKSLFSGEGTGRGGNQKIKNEKSDLNLARLCLCLACIGTALLGFAKTRTTAILSLAVLAAGTGFQAAYFSYVTSKLPKREITRVCMAFSMAQYASVEFGGFVVGELYSFCLQREQAWMNSLPIWLCSVMFAFTIMLLCRSD